MNELFLGDYVKTKANASKTGALLSQEYFEERADYV